MQSIRPISTTQNNAGYFTAANIATTSTPQQGLQVDTETDQNDYVFADD